MDCVYEYEDVKKEIEFGYTVRELQEEVRKEFVYVEQINELVKVKTCDVCEVLKTLVEFYKSKSYKDGYLSNCKMCSRKQSKRNLANSELDKLKAEAKEKERQRLKYLRKKELKNYYNNN